MSLINFKFISRLINPIPINSPIIDGDIVDVAMNKLQGQISNLVGRTTGTNTGDNAVNTLYSGLVSNATHTGDATGSTTLTVIKINGTQLSTLATGILKNTTSTGVPSIAVSGTDYAPATSGSSILYGNGTGGFSAVTVGTGLSFTTGTLTATNQGTITSVTGTAPVVSSGGITPAISMAAATTLVNGYLTFTDWTTFNNKSNTVGTVTSVASIALGSTGTDLSSTVATGTTTPVITLQVPTASATNRGALSSTDWTTFNNKYSTGTALGTPLSGTVTNLTGTASISINGTVGATTPAQATFTNLITNTQNYFLQVTPTVINATSTLTISQLLTNIITSTSTVAVSLTLPTGTLTDAGILAGASAVNTSFYWTMINTGTVAGVITLVAGTGHTIVGLATTPIASTSNWRTRKTATNTYVTYRL